MPQAEVKQLAWSVGLHQSVKTLSPASEWLTAILSCDGLSAEDVLKRLPFDKSRSRGVRSETPNARRYRDAREVVQTMGLGYEDESGFFHVTDFGRATKRWLPQLRISNGTALGRHAAYALSACTLRNPMRKRIKYDSGVTARPFSYLWRAMLALDDRISTDEINRALLYALDEDGLSEAIDRIALQRNDQSKDFLLPEVESGSSKNDRIIPIVAAASFGYLFIATKPESKDGHYRIRNGSRNLLLSATQAYFPQVAISDTPTYVRYLSDVASLPRDLR